MQPTSLSIVLLTITSTFYIVSSGEQLCTLKNGLSGVCITIRNCSEARNLLRTRTKPQLCGFNRSQPLVCCGATSNGAQNLQNRIAQEKCLEYNRTLRRKKRQLYTPIVLGGKSTKPFEFPHMAILGYGDVSEITWRCGGSLISEKFVLTAAHCINTQIGPVKHVALGVHNLDDMDWDNSVEKFTVKRIHIHPQYNQRRRYHDVALIELDRPARMRATVNPACLYFKRQLPKEDLIVTGWGALYVGGSSSKILQAASLTSVSYKSCKGSFSQDRRLPEGLKDDSQICAKGAKHNKNADTCQGDSGGPLQVFLKKQNAFAIVGITSFGIKCGILPGVYTRVSNYVPWIENIVWPG